MKSAVEAGQNVGRGAAAGWQDRPEKAEHDQQHEGDDVVRDRMEAHGDHPEELQRSAIAEVAGKAAHEISKGPGDQRAGQQQPNCPGQGAANQDGNRGRKGRQRGPEVGGKNALPIREVLFHQRTASAVQLAQSNPHHGDGLRAALPHGRDSRDHLVDRVDWRQMRDEEGQRDADEDDEDELREALQDVDAIGAHRSFPARGAAALAPGAAPEATSGLCARARAGVTYSCVGFSRTIM